MNSELTREEALGELAEPPYPTDEMREDEQYILKKLEITPAQWQAVLDAPLMPNDAYFSQRFVVELGQRLLGRERAEAVRRQKSK
ncbi:MAG: hypothetical protein RR367_11895 [Clostridia bacterium]